MKTEKSYKKGLPGFLNFTKSPQWREDDSVTQINGAVWQMCIQSHSQPHWKLCTWWKCYLSPSGKGDRGDLNEKCLQKLQKQKRISTLGAVSGTTLEGAALLGEIKSLGRAGRAHSLVCTPTSLSSSSHNGLSVQNHKPRETFSSLRCFWTWYFTTAAEG